MEKIRILPTEWMNTELYKFKDEYRHGRYCPEDFQKGWRVLIEIPKYKRKGTEFREGVVEDVRVPGSQPHSSVTFGVGTQFTGRGLALELRIEEQWRGRKNRLQPRAYSYYKIINAWLISSA
ncbi:MAG: hypothetical protein AABX71_02395 [Nanoarchaeota archaeon]